LSECGECCQVEARKNSAGQDGIHTEGQRKRARLQAVGRDAAGRLQYRYHPEWERVRNSRKTLRLDRLADALPGVRGRVGACLAAKTPSRAFALAAVIELVGRAISASSRRYRYVLAHGTRGATTQSHVRSACFGATID
jgi:DNA topoisomerase-1